VRHQSLAAQPEKNQSGDQNRQSARLAEGEPRREHHGDDGAAEPQQIDPVHQSTDPGQQNRRRHRREAVNGRKRSFSTAKVRRQERHEQGNEERLAQAGCEGEHPAERRDRPRASPGGDARRQARQAQAQPL